MSFKKNIAVFKFYKRQQQQQHQSFVTFYKLFTNFVFANLNALEINTF